MKKNEDIIDGLTTLELEYTLLVRLNPRLHILVPNVSWGMGLYHECDILKLTKSGYATEIEIKISKSDILKDKKKWHKHKSKWIKYLYFAVPAALKDFALEHIPERAGLYIVYKRLLDDYAWAKASIALSKNEQYGYFMDEVRKAKANPQALQWDQKQREHLMHLAIMRFVNMKKKFLQNELKNKTSLF